MKKHILTLLIVLLALPVWGADCVQGSLVCGCTMVGDITLTGDFDCTGNATALTIGADGVDITGGGYTITADTSLIVLDGYDTTTIDNVILSGGSRSIYSTAASGEVVGFKITNSILTGASTASIHIGYGSGIYIGEDVGEATSLNHSNEFYNNRSAIIFGRADLTPSADEAVTNSYILSNYIHNDFHLDSYDNGGHEIDLCPYSDNNTISKNDFDTNGYASGSDYGTDLVRGVIVSTDGSKNTIIEQNNFHDNYTGCIEVGEDSNADRIGDGVKILSNVFSNNARANYDGTDNLRHMRIIQTMASATGAASMDLDLLIANNTFFGNQNTAGTVNNGAACIFLAGTSDISGVVIKNNIAYANENLSDFRVYTQNGTMSYTEDYNIWYRASGDYLHIGNIAATTAYPSSNSFADFKTATGGSHSLNVDPLFVNSSAGDYRVKSGSPAENAGVAVAGVTYDYANNTRSDPPEIGAYEVVKTLHGVRF